jgi:aldose sugar dehydrogenase
LIPGSSIAIVALIIFTAAIIPCEPKPVYAQQQSLKDPNLAVESFVEGLSSPTSMGLMDNNNILILEKDGHCCFSSVLFSTDSPKE